MFFAFGVVLAELITRKRALMRETNTMKSLITVITKVFEEEEDLEDTLISVRDGSLRDSYPMDDLYKNKCPEKGLFHWFKFMSSEAECELPGFLEASHIWEWRTWLCQTR